MITAEKYVTLWSQEVEYGSEHVRSIKIQIAINDRELNDADKRAARKAAEALVTAIELETARLDPKAAERKIEERKELLALFDGKDIFAEEIPNGYCSQPCCSQKPWYIVTTRWGRITLGWRKRVIEIKWDESVGPIANELFPNEDVTKIDHLIHAWSLEKAQEYIQKLTPDMHWPQSYLGIKQ